MNYYIDIQNVSTHPIPVTDEELTSWAEMTLKEHQEHAELTLRLVDKEEISNLNQQYRQKNKPTNVLAFPSELPDSIVLDCPFLGDIIICPEVLEEESKELHQTLKQHWAHIVIHGILHLLGYDHIKDDDALRMQEIEIKLLAKLNYSNPYLIEEK